MIILLRKISGKLVEKHYKYGFLPFITTTYQLSCQSYDVNHFSVENRSLLYTNAISSFFVLLHIDKVSHFIFYLYFSSSIPLYLPTLTMLITSVLKIVHCHFPTLTSYSQTKPNNLILPAFLVLALLTF